MVGADRLHAQGVTGTGVAIALVDTGVSDWKELTYEGWRSRVRAAYDALLGQEIIDDWDYDLNGHGTHLTSVAVNNKRIRKSGLYEGVAPGADLVVVKAFGASGSGTYADVIRGISWVIANKDLHGTRVLNLSFSAPPRSHYWDDPLNQAVMAAWEAGIVVVASAGNTGPEPMTIGVPGNVPYVITVGAMTDNFTPTDHSDDRLTSFSSAGPTHAGFVKPEVVAPGGHVKAIMDHSSEIAKAHPEFHETGMSRQYRTGTDDHRRAG